MELWCVSSNLCRMARAFTTRKALPSDLRNWFRHCSIVTSRASGQWKRHFCELDLRSPGYRDKQHRPRQPNECDMRCDGKPVHDPYANGDRHYLQTYRTCT